MYKVRLDIVAAQDLVNIHNYIKYNLQSPTNADNQVLRLERAILKLDSLPERYPHYRRIEDTDVRMMPVDNYIVLYSVDNNEKQVNILHIIYKRKDGI